MRREGGREGVSGKEREVERRWGEEREDGRREREREEGKGDRGGRGAMIKTCISSGIVCVMYSDV